jgi:hypothetical protein
MGPSRIHSLEHPSLALQGGDATLAVSLPSLADGLHMCQQDRITANMIGIGSPIGSIRGHKSGEN